MRILVFCGTLDAIARFEREPDWRVAVGTYRPEQVRQTIEWFNSTPGAKLAVDRSYCQGWRAHDRTAVLFDPSWPFAPSHPTTKQAVGRRGVGYRPAIIGADFPSKPDTTGIQFHPVPAIDPEILATSQAMREGLEMATGIGTVVRLPRRMIWGDLETQPGGTASDPPLSWRGWITDHSLVRVGPSRRMVAGDLMGAWHPWAAWVAWALACTWPDTRSLGPRKE